MLIVYIVVLLLELITYSLNCFAVTVELLLEEMRNLREELVRARTPVSSPSTLLPFGPRFDGNFSSSLMNQTGKESLYDEWVSSMFFWVLLVSSLSISLGGSCRLFLVSESLGMPKCTVSTFSLLKYLFVKSFF